MELMGGIGILVLIVLTALHLACRQKKKIRLTICIILAIGCCSTGTMHGVFFGIALICAELILGKIINWN